jgi:hypothetical protein
MRSVEDMMVFSCFVFGEVVDLDELKGGKCRASGLMTLSILHLTVLSHCSRVEEG